MLREREGREEETGDGGSPLPCMSEDIGIWRICGSSSSQLGIFIHSTGPYWLPSLGLVLCPPLSLCHPRGLSQVGPHLFASRGSGLGNGNNWREM